MKCFDIILSRNSWFVSYNFYLMSTNIFVDIRDDWYIKQKQNTRNYA